MSTPQKKRGLAELRDARRESRALYWFVGIFSLFVNLLMLTGPIYMLQVYDRVLGSRSEATLIAPTMLVAFLYGMMGLLDFARGRIMGRVGANFQARLDRRVFEAVLRKSAIVKMIAAPQVCVILRPFSCFKHRPFRWRSMIYHGPHYFY